MKYGAENGEPIKHKKELKQSRKLHKLEHRDVYAMSYTQANSITGLNNTSVLFKN